MKLSDCFLVLYALPFLIIGARVIRGIIQTLNERDDPRQANRPSEPP